MKKFEEIIENHEEYTYLPEGVKKAIVINLINVEEDDNVSIRCIWDSYEEYGKAYISRNEDYALTYAQEKEFSKYVDYDAYGRNLVATSYLDFDIYFNNHLYIVEYDY